MSHLTVAKDCGSVADLLLTRAGWLRAHLLPVLPPPVLMRQPQDLHTATRRTI